MSRLRPFIRSLIHPGGSHGQASLWQSAVSLPRTAKGEEGFVQLGSTEQQTKSARHIGVNCVLLDSTLGGRRRQPHPPQIQRRAMLPNEGRVAWDGKLAQSFLTQRDRSSSPSRDAESVRRSVGFLCLCCSHRAARWPRAGWISRSSLARYVKLGNGTIR